MAMLLGALGFIAFLVVGTAAVLAMTVVGVVLVPVGLVLSPVVVLAIVLLLRVRRTVASEARPRAVEKGAGPALPRRATEPSQPASGQESVVGVKRAA